MADRRAELTDLTERFVDAFNQNDLDGIISFFADNGVFEDPEGVSHEGTAAVRAAFAPLVEGAMGKIQFDGEDLFMDVEAGKVMTSWRLSLEVEGKPASIRGLDLLRFEGDKLVRKQAYWKAALPQFE
jgi:ketosteroid isomerase-like protein